MFFSPTTFIGIDPTAGKKPFAYAAIDPARQLLALGQDNMDTILAFAAGQSQAIVAVCSPFCPNQGLMENEKVRQELSPPPKPGRWTDFRVAEYLLRQRNIKIPKTPSKIQDCPGWVQKGFILYARLKEIGYRQYPSEGASRQFLEVYPHGCYAVLLGQNPLLKHTLEGRLQRQLCLYEQRLNVADPMRFFEEITRHRLLNGVLPFEELRSPQELDALAAAYTAWMSTLHPNQITMLGDPVEGQIVLPGVELKERY